jgi:hypothetical protein
MQFSKPVARHEVQALEQAVRAAVSEFEIVCASLQTCAPVMFRRELSYFMTAAQRELNNSSSSGTNNNSSNAQQQYCPVPQAEATDSSIGGSNGVGSMQEQQHYGSYSVHIGSVVHSGLANGFARASKASYHQSPYNVSCIRYIIGA